MAQRKIEANTMLLKIDVAGGTSYDTVICLTSVSTTNTTNVIDANSLCGPDKLAGIADAGEVSFEGQIMLEPGTNTISLKGIWDSWKDKDIIGWSITPNVPAPTDAVLSGTGFISNLDINWTEIDAVSTFSCTITNKSVPTLTIVS